jgi:hypothetical protein
MATQSLVSVIFEAANPIEKSIAVELDTTGKLTPCADATKFFGVAIPNLEPDLATLRVVPTSGPLVVYHKGLVKTQAVAGTYTKGQKLTIDTANSGILKAAADTDTAVAIIAEDATLADTGDLLVYII